MKNLLLFVRLLSLSLWFTACNCEPEFVVTPEDIRTPFWVEDVRFECFYIDISPYFIERLAVEFNQPVGQNSMVLGETVMLKPDVAKQDSMPYFSANGRTMYIPTCYIICEISDPTVTLDLVSTDDGGDGVLSASGQPLDGDKDGADGGTATFKVVMDCQAPPAAFQVDTVWVECFQINPNAIQKNIVVRFNKPVDSTSVRVFDQFPTVFTDPFSFATFPFHYFSQDYTTVYFPSCEVACMYNHDTTLLTLKSKLNDPSESILSMDGEYLDGNFDFMQGGDFTELLMLDVGCN